MLCPKIARDLPFLNLPNLAPSNHTATKAAQPPTECTRVEPAKSWNPPSSPPSVERNPPPHCQEPTIGYTNPTYIMVKIINPPIFTRSATAPETIVAAVAANIP